MKAKRINVVPNPNPHGFRYSRDGWEAVIKPMLDGGATYHQIAQRLGVSHTTVTRFVWAQGWATPDLHRNTVRASIRKGVQP
jgi:transposase